MAIVQLVAFLKISSGQSPVSWLGSGVDVFQESGQGGSVCVQSQLLTDADIDIIHACLVNDILEFAGAEPGDQQTAVSDFQGSQVIIQEARYEMRAVRGVQKTDGFQEFFSVLGEGFQLVCDEIQRRGEGIAEKMTDCAYFACNPLLR